MSESVSVNVCALRYVSALIEIKRFGKWTKNVKVGGVTMADVSKKCLYKNDKKKTYELYKMYSGGERSVWLYNLREDILDAH